MTLASQQLFALAERVAQPYLQHIDIRAAMVTGSVAKGIADTYSDIDMFFFYRSTLPDDTQLDTIRTTFGGSARKWLIGSREECSFAEAYELGGVELQIGHATIAAWEATMAEVLVEHKVGTPLAKALEGILNCQSLYGFEYIERWREQAANFPAPLAEALVRHHLAFFPAWGLIPYFRTRDATIWHYHILVESIHNLLGVLAGLNQIYYSTFQFKRTRRFINQCSITPTNLAERIEQLFDSRPEIALPELEQLVSETLNLVEQHMPQIDTSSARKRIGWRRPVWHAHDFAMLPIRGAHE